MLEEKLLGVVATPASFPRPRHELWCGMIIITFLLLVVWDFLPFYVDLPSTWELFLVENKTSYYIPIGWAAGLLGLLFTLVALAGGRAQRQALRPCSVLVHPEILIHVVNVLSLVGVFAWWGGKRRIRADADASDLFDALGYVSGKVCKLMMGLCLLPIARRSLWLDAAAVGFPEGVAFHRITGWWCIAQVVVHMVCYTVDEAIDAMSDFTSWDPHNNQTGHGPSSVGAFDGSKWYAGWKAVEVFYWPWETRLNRLTGEPEPNTEGMFILIGFIGALGAIALAVFSRPNLRRARYDLFYLIHLPASALFIILGAVHDWQMQAFVVPGLVTYFLDRTGFLDRTATSCFLRVVAHVRVMTDDWVRIDVVDTLGVIASEAAFGTQFMYLRVPALGGESHAFSLASRCPSLVIKASGDWTRRLHQLAVTQATEAVVTQRGSDEQQQANDLTNAGLITMEQVGSITTKLVCEMDGVYGNASPPWCSFSHVLFVGGGVGVTPWLPAMEEHLEMCHLEDGSMQTMRLVWIARNHTELNAMGPYLPHANTTVFLTRENSPGYDTLFESQVVLEDSTVSAQSIVGKSESRPWLFVFVGVVSLCLTDLSYYYLRGVKSIYAEYEEANDGDPTLTQYVLYKVLPVLCSFAAIAATTIFARWASKRLASLKCAWVTSAHGTDTTAGEKSQESHGSSQGQQKLTPSAAVKYGRPDIAALMDEAVAEVEVASAAPSSPIRTGLFVCVCGPSALAQSWKDAIRDAKRRHKEISIGLHVEQPDW